MKLSLSCLVLASSLCAAACAHADTITLASYGTGDSSFGSGNTALAYGTAATYDIPTNGPWIGIANSSWVSFNQNTAPGGSYIAPSGTYTYTTSFTSTATSFGSITVLADDTTSVYLNGTLITSAAPATTAGTCTIGTPNCTLTATYILSGFVDGSNTLTFGVKQLYGGATGLDFAGNVTTPEPSSLILLGTGLASAAGLARRRFLRKA